MLRSGSVRVRTTAARSARVPRRHQHLKTSGAPNFASLNIHFCRHKRSLEVASETSGVDNVHSLPVLSAAVFLLIQFSDLSHDEVWFWIRDLKNVFGFEVQESVISVGPGSHPTWPISCLSSAVSYQRQERKGQKRRYMWL